MAMEKEQLAYTMLLERLVHVIQDCGDKNSIIQLFKELQEEHDYSDSGISSILNEILEYCEQAELYELMGTLNEVKELYEI